MNNANDYANHLPSKLRLALWKRIDRHLQQGEALISTEHFFRVMEQEFARLIGVRPSAKIRQALCEMIAHVNEQHSDKYMACGIHNAVKDYLARMPHQRDGGEETMEQMRQRLRRTVRDGRAGAFLESIGVEVGPTGATPSMAKAIEKALEVNKEVGVGVESSEVKVRRRGAGLERVAVRVSGADLAAAAADEGAVKESLAEDQGSVKQVAHISTREAEVAAGQMVRPRPHPDGCQDEDVLDDDDLPRCARSTVSTTNSPPARSTQPRPIGSALRSTTSSAAHVQNAPGPRARRSGRNSDGLYSRRARSSHSKTDMQ